MAIVALLVAAQIAVSLSVRTQRVHNFLVLRLENAFGRPVQVKHFNLEILPSPRIYATGVTVGENPAFGYEYFLRAEHLTAGLRWSGFLRGRFELGTLSVGQPSLNLVRNRQGRWNLEVWLPPARINPPSQSDRAAPYSPAPPPPLANRLERIEFADGRMNFKSADVKQPFALTNVSGSVEQLSPGRWQLRLNAQPWRSGVALQSAGAIDVQGDIAGTSSRLQPASLAIRWDKVSLADLFRLLRGQDYGVRGTVSLQATAKSGAPTANPAAAPDFAKPFFGSEWSYALKATASQIHRWDLTERPDNPNLLVSVNGRWNVALGMLTAETLLVQTPFSHLQGNAQFGTASNPFLQVKFNSAAIQSPDVLSWYRAFRPDVAEGIAVDEFFTGALAFQGWPLTLQAVDLSTLGGSASFRGVDDTLKIGPARLLLDHSKLVMDPVRISFASAASRTPQPLRIARTVRRRAPNENTGEATLQLTHDFLAHSGNFTAQGQVDNAENILKIASAFGRTLNHGWDLTGPAHGSIRREWSSSAPPAWIGSAEVTDAQLAAAGLNQPVQLQQARLEWRNGKRAAQITRAEGFGANWSGNILEEISTDPQQQNTWHVQMHADHLDATEMDRWVGPRARPGWLQRLLPSLLGGSASQSQTSSPATISGPASELVRRLNVSGDLRVDEFTIEKLKLQQLLLQGTLQDLKLNILDGRAQWAGGSIRATMLARFLPRPSYDVHAELDGIVLSQLPIDSSAADRLGGLATGSLHIKTAGVGRDELLQKLTATGKMHLTDLEFRGWDLNASVADGEAHPGISRWAAGDGSFAVHDRRVFLDDVRLDGGAQTTLLNGTVTFSRDADLAIQSSAARRSLRNVAAPEHILKIVGPLDDPRVSQEKNAPRQPAD